MPEHADHMEANFLLASDAHTSLIDGDLEAAQHSARELISRMARSTFPDTWQPYLDRLRERAEVLAQAPDADQAGKALGLIAVACADCHVQLHAELAPLGVAALPTVEPPEDIRWRMFRHAVGVDQMWLGLLIPSDEDFASGTTTLIHAPLTPPQVHGEDVSPESHAAIDLIRKQAERARAATRPEERAAAYGQLVATCSKCHSEHHAVGP